MILCQTWGGQNSCYLPTIINPLPEHVIPFSFVIRDFRIYDWTNKSFGLRNNICLHSKRVLICGRHWNGLKPSHRYFFGCIDILCTVCNVPVIFTTGRAALSVPLNLERKFIVILQIPFFEFAIVTLLTNSRVGVNFNWETTRVSVRSKTEGARFEI
jgi:hypothetical protein